MRCGEPQQPFQTRAQRSGSRLRAFKNNFFDKLKSQWHTNAIGSFLSPHRFGAEGFHAAAERAETSEIRRERREIAVTAHRAALRRRRYCRSRLAAGLRLPARRRERRGKSGPRAVLELVPQRFAPRVIARRALMYTENDAVVVRGVAPSTVGGKSTNRT